MLTQPFFRAVLTLASGTAIGQLVLVGATPLLTRLYTPQEFGLLAVFVAVTAPILVVSSLRYEFAIPIPRNCGHARMLLFLALALNAIMATLSLVLVVLFREDVALLSKTPALSEYLWLMPPFILCAGSYKAFNYWAVRNKDYKAISSTKAFQSLANIGTQLTLGVSGLGGGGLILGQFVGQTLGAAALGKGARLSNVCSERKTLKRRLRVLLRRYRRFPLYDAPAAIIDVASMQLPNLMLAAFFSPTVAGLYLLAERVILMPMGLVGQAVGQALLGASGESIRDGTLRLLAVKIVTRLAAVIVVPTVMMFFWAEGLFSWAFGPEWREAGQYGSWMILGLSIQFLYSPISMVLMATNGQKLNLYIHVFMLLGKTGAIIYGHFLASPLIAIMGFSFWGGAGYLVAIFVVLSHAKKFIAGNEKTER